MTGHSPIEARRFRISAHWSALPSLLLLWAGLTLIIKRLTRRPAAVAATTSAAITLGHILSDLWHQLGHAAAARLTGYPMRGLRFWTIMIASFYPPDEPPLPAKIHLRRALGGPIASALLTLLLGILARALKPSLARRTIWFLCLENLFAFTLQAFVPLGFNDGATIRKWTRKQP